MVKTKEISLTPTISEHDMNHKLVNAFEILAKGHNLKLVMFFKGRSIVFQEAGKQKLLSFVRTLEESKLGKLNSEPKLHGKRLVAIVNFKKKELPANYRSDINMTIVKTNNS